MKKTICALLAILFSFSFAMAEDLDHDNNEPAPAEYVGVTNTHVELYRVSGTLRCYGELIVRENYSASVTWTLQKGNPWNATSFSNYASWSDSGTGYRKITIDSNRPLSSNTCYRLKEDAFIYDINGSLVEHITIYSNIIRNP